jgi:hypothetical protein
LGGYAAGLLLISRAALASWGWDGAIGAAGGVLVATSLVATLAGRVVRRKPPGAAGALLGAEAGGKGRALAHGAATGAGGAPSRDGVSSPGDLLADLMASRSRVLPWETVASIALAAAAILGPIRVLRLGVRICRVARSLREILETNPGHDEAAWQVAWQREGRHRRRVRR